VRDGIVRIDCAVVAIGAGRFVVAGGCANHPSRARKFFCSAFIYDASGPCEKTSPARLAGAAQAALVGRGWLAGARGMIWR